MSRLFDWETAQAQSLMPIAQGSSFPMLFLGFRPVSRLLTMLYNVIHKKASPYSYILHFTKQAYDLA